MRSAISYWMFEAVMMGRSQPWLRFLSNRCSMRRLLCSILFRILTFTRNPPCFVGWVYVSCPLYPQKQGWFRVFYAIRLKGSLVQGLETGGQSTADFLSATGTDDSTTLPLAPTLAPTTGKTCILGSIVDKMAADAGKTRGAETVAVSACPVNRKDPLTAAVNGLRQERETGFEPATSSLGS